MKIKLNINMGDKVPGDIVDASVSKSKNYAVFYSGEVYFSIFDGQFEILDETVSNKIESIRNLLGQDMTRIEFK